MQTQQFSFLGSYKKLVTIFVLFGMTFGLLLAIEPRIAGLIMLPLRLMAYASGGQAKQGCWLLLFLALTFSSLVITIVVCLILGTIFGKTIDQLTVLMGLGVLMFVAITVIASLIFVVGSVMDRLR
jgi:hypothetical protein